MRDVERGPRICWWKAGVGGCLKHTLVVDALRSTVALLIEMARDVKRIVIEVQARHTKHEGGQIHDPFHRRLPQVNTMDPSKMAMCFWACQ